MTAPSSESGGSPAAEPSVDQLERELVRLRAELAEYQTLIDDLPQIYEEKFRGQVQDLVQDIRRLMDERQALQEQVSHALSPAASAPPAPSLAPGAPAAPAQPSPARPPGQGLGQHWSGLVRRFSLQSGRQTLHQVRTALIPRLRGQGRWFALAFALAVAGSTLALLRTRTAPTPAPLPPAGSVAGTRPEDRPATGPAAERPPVPKAPADQDLRLRATGESWLEVSTLDGEVVYVNTLQDGEETTIRLGEGLRVRSGRPDLLTFGVGNQPLQVFGPVDDISWRTVLPGKTDQEPSAESSNRGL